MNMKDVPFPDNSRSNDCYVCVDDHHDYDGCNDDYEDCDDSYDGCE